MQSPIWDELREWMPSPREGFMNFRYEELEKELEKRPEFAKRYSWGFPSPLAIARIVEFAAGDIILEVGAGLGLWARLLQDEGAHVIATDEKPGWTYSHPQEQRDSYTHVEQMGAARAVTAHPEAKVLMMIWPPYATPMARLALARFKGDRFVYVGEREGGCNGDDAFFRRLEREWWWDGTWDDWPGVPQWPGIHDGLQLFRRRDNTT